MFRLAALALRDPLLQMILVILLIDLVLLTLFLLWKYLIAKKIKVQLLFKTGNFKYIKRTAALIMLLFLISTAVIFIHTGIRQKPTGPNIILVVVDCLRADHLSCCGYSRETSPNIDDLAGEGILFKNAYSNSPWTKPSVASIFTSLHANKHNTINIKNTLPGEALTIAEVLKNSGYHTCFINGGNPHLTGRFNFDQGFDTYISQSRADRLTNKFLAYMKTRKKQKFFTYLHYMDLHLPYNDNRFNGLFSNTVAASFFKPGKILMDNVRLLTERKCLSAQEKNDLEALYDGQIKFIDTALKDITAALKKENMFENTLIIITADHGEEFWEHNNYEHGHTVYNEVIHVPLIIAGGKFKNTVINNPVSLVDLFPTILAAAHIPVENDTIHGKNLLKVQPKPVFSMGTLFGTEKYCLVKGKMKLVFNSGTRRGKKPLPGYRSNDKFELYNLESDPMEKHNLKNDLPEIVAKMKKELDKFKNISSPLRGRKAALDKEEELKEKLKSLGYL